jgi:hypothetical protein
MSGVGLEPTTQCLNEGSQIMRCDWPENYVEHITMFRGEIKRHFALKWVVLIVAAMLYTSNSASNVRVNAQASLQNTDRAPQLPRC